MKTKILIFAALLSIGVFIGCTTNEKVDAETTSKAITSDDAVINSEIDAAVDDVSLIVEDQYSFQIGSSFKTSQPIKSMMPACATFTFVLTNDTFTRTIDFGTQGCTLNNGNVVKGKIIIVFSKNVATPIRTISYTLSGFYHNDKLIEGSKTLTQELKTSDLLASIHPVTTHTIDLKITYPDGKIYSRVGTRVREMVDGITTLTNWEDNVFKIWGNYVTNFPNGSKFTCTTEKTTALLFKMSCKKPFPVSGILVITKNDGKATIDYGNGECDDVATITINNATKEFQLKK